MIMTVYSFKFIYPDDQPKRTVSDLLRTLNIPRKWRHFLRIEKKITINGHYRSFNQFVLPEDQVTLCFDHVASQQHDYLASGHQPQVVYEDDNVLIIDKPAGQKTHPNENETNTALNDCTTYLGYHPYITHRLDMLTRGLLLVAKNPVVVPLLNRQLVDKTLNREYIACVEKGRSEELKPFGTISEPISQDPTDPRKRCVTVAGYPAVTHYAVLSQNDRIAWLKITLETGRTHQIRVHLAAKNNPILGDPLYNPNYKVGQRLALTAFRLTFKPPFQFDPKTITLPDFDH